MTFELDGRNVGLFQYSPTTDRWVYNFSVFSRDGLDNTQHTFVIQPQGVEASSYLVFDYFAYE